MAARADEIGIPFAITVDYEARDTDAVTLRERDSCAQLRVPVRASPTRFTCADR